jgi:uncharacterized membrane protein
MNNNHNGGAEHGSEHQGHQVEHKKGGNAMAVFAYLGILLIIPFVTDAKNDPFVKYHLKQGLALIIAEAIGWFVTLFIGWIPFLGWLIVLLFWLACLVLTIVGIMNVLNGTEKELPWIGQYGKSFNF